MTLKICINGETRDMTSEEEADYFARTNAPIPVLQQIADLEAKVTTRRLLEAMTGEDDGWLRDIRAQISTLREQLT